MLQRKLVLKNIMKELPKMKNKNKNKKPQKHFYQSQIQVIYQPETWLMGKIRQRKKQEKSNQKCVFKWDFGCA